MLNAIPHQLRIFLCTEPADMRKNFNGLTGLVRKSMMLDPLSGHLYIFRNQRGDRLKVLYWDSDGFALWYKQLQRGTFRFPDLKNYSSAGLEIDHSTLRLILDGIDLSTIRRQHRYKINPRMNTSQPQSPPFISSAYKPQEQNFLAANHNA
jgi:transposase